MISYLNNEAVIEFSDLPNDVKQFIIDHYVYLNATDQFFFNRNSGLFWKLHEGVLTNDRSAVIIYKNLYPFTTSIFVSNKEEFEDGNFKRVIKG